MKLLILDDDPKVRFNLNLYLSDEGYSCHEYESAESALKSITPGKYHAAIVDIALPGLFGDDFILRAKSVDPKLKCVIHTGHLSFNLPRELQNIGMNEDDVFYKPVLDLNSLKEKIVSL
ncbi:MAG: response regulator [Ignavibacteriales bacterium]|nr:response regulator [Ignavibacteriales bacterium]